MSQDGDDLVTFLKVGRGPSDADNTTGVQMPPRGGNPSLGDDDLTNVVAYLKSLG
jgi:disulfide bond formation protein DsbB